MSEIDTFTLSTNTLAASLAGAAGTPLSTREKEHLVKLRRKKELDPAQTTEDRRPNDHKPGTPRPRNDGVEGNDYGLA